MPCKSHSWAQHGVEAETTRGPLTFFSGICFLTRDLSIQKCICSKAAEEKAQRPTQLLLLALAREEAYSSSSCEQQNKGEDRAWPGNTCLLQNKFNCLLQKTTEPMNWVTQIWRGKVPESIPKEQPLLLLTLTEGASPPWGEEPRGTLSLVASVSTHCVNTILRQGSCRQVYHGNAWHRRRAQPDPTHEQKLPTVYVSRV